MPRDTGVPLSMRGIHPECPDPEGSRWSVATDALLRQEPDDDEDEGKEEDDDDGDDDADDGYSE